MSELENIKSLEKYDQWKKAKRDRKSYISLIAGLIGTLVGLLIVWGITKVSLGDTWTCTKTIFVSEDKIEKSWPKVEEIDNKLKKSILAQPLNFASEKIDEQAGKDLIRGDFNALTKAARLYSMILVVVWLLVWGIASIIPSLISSWIIGKFIWKEPLLSEQEID